MAQGAGLTTWSDNQRFIFSVFQSPRLGPLDLERQATNNPSEVRCFCKHPISQHPPPLSAHLLRTSTPSDCKPPKTHNLLPKDKSVWLFLRSVRAGVRFVLAHLTRTVDSWTAGFSYIFGVSAFTNTKMELAPPDTDTSTCRTFEASTFALRIKFGNRALHCGLVRRTSTPSYTRVWVRSDRYVVFVLVRPPARSVLICLLLVLKLPSYLPLTVTATLSQE